MSSRAPFKFRLYVAGDTLNSIQATANLRKFCRSYLPDGHEIEIVDVLSQPNRALDEAVFMTPTLIKWAPLPVRRIVGTLSQTEPILTAFGLDGLQE